MITLFYSRFRFFKKVLRTRVVAKSGIPFFYGRGYRYFPESNCGELPESIFFRKVWPSFRRNFHFSAIESDHTKNEPWACWLRGRRCACRT